MPFTSLTHAWRHWHRPLMYFTASMAALAVFSAAGLLIDPRTVAGDPVWLKPLKFGLSFGAYALSAAWLLSRLPQAKARLGRVLGTVLVAVSTAEMVLIVGQAARGRRSHFNGDTALDAAIFNAMAGFAGAIWLASVAIAWVVLRQRIPDPAMALAIRAGFVLALFGMAVAVSMGTDAQHDPATNSLGAHSVGAPDGGEGMPVTGWSSTAGDIRVPHFIGMHALQLLPLLVWLLDSAAPRLPRLGDGAVRYRLIRASAVAATGVLALVTWQAFRGQPLLSPDGATWAALLGVVALALLASLPLLPGPRSLRAGGGPPSAAKPGPAAAAPTPSTSPGRGGDGESRGSTGALSAEAGGGTATADRRTATADTSTAATEGPEREQSPA